jgi:predicted PurR-regulated permease PerM
VSEPSAAPTVAPGPARRSPLPVPPLLADVAAWSWRLLLLAAAAYALVRFLDLMHLVVLPIIAALLATALAHPIVMYFRRRGFARAVATWLTVLVTLAVVAGIFFLVVQRASDQYPQLVGDLQQSVGSVQRFLTNDLHLKSGAINNVGSQVTKYLSAHETSILSNGVTIAKSTGEVLADVVLWFFITFFLLYDGENIWDWVVGLLPRAGEDRMRGAGDKAWARLAGFVRGTFLIALFHAVVAAVALAALQVPLVLPLALLVFVGSFLPIIGSLIFGGLAVLITFVTRGAVPGIVLIGVLIIDNQIEAHILQPFLVGRYVRLHPVAVAVSIAGGAVLEGLPGAVLAVPTVAVIYAVSRYLVLGDEESQPADEGTVPGERSGTPPVEDRLVPEASE